ncbi:MAG: 50S ribosomal protein L11 methyltransferase [Nitrospirales bacterium]|nr:50S ribosomal protein L11 methyltransferase [Nitrospirales bacterium]
MKIRHFEVKIPQCVDASELAGMCDGPDFLGVWEQDGLMSLFWQGTGEAALNHVKVALKLLGVELPEKSIALLPGVEQDWNARWAASVQPICVGRRFFIRPSWSAISPPESRIELVLDPKQAFGTGHHATTQLLLEWLEEVNWHPGDRILDIGTGSGILCMGALRLGASSALGIDVDATAIACAREYAMVNNLTEELELVDEQMTEIPEQAYAVIIANLDRRTLLSLSPYFSRFRSPRTALYLSGLLCEDEADIRVVFQREGWTHRATRMHEGWIAIQFAVASPVSSSSGCDSR